MADSRYDAVMTNNPDHNRKIHGIYKNVILRNRVDGGVCPWLPYPWIMSANVGYRHFWLWDTAFNTAGSAAFGGNWVKETYNNFWHWMDHNPNFPAGSPGYGMIPGMIETTHRWYYYTYKYTQLPLVAWGVWMVYLQNPDRSFLEKALPYLIQYDQWYSRERDVDNDLLIEVRAYTGEVQHARFETFDFKPSLDRMRMTNRQGQLTGDRWYGDVELVEMTALVIEMEKVIACIAEGLGEIEMADKYRKIASAREDAMNRVMWDANDGFYYDVHRDTHEKVKVKTIAGFFPMFSKSCTHEQAARLVEHLTDPDEFWTNFPVATAAKSEPVYRSDGFWRGDTWIMTNYLVSAGLNNYGYYELAKNLLISLSRWSMKIPVTNGTTA